jgi:uncharacterized membrane protein
VPRSRLRRKADFTPPPKRSPQKLPSRPWVAPLMVTLFLVGLLWIVVYYVTRGDIPGMRALGDWNLLVGFAMIAVGFAVSTQWR